MSSKSKSVLQKWQDSLTSNTDADKQEKRRIREERLAAKLALEYEIQKTKPPIEDIPMGATVTMGKHYWMLRNMPLHKLVKRSGNLGYHRWKLFEALGQPEVSKCHWCGFWLPWVSSLSGSALHIVNTDHLNGNKVDNDPKNLVPSCAWCNLTRSWAEAFPEFWAKWRIWMRDVPPWERPNIRQMASDEGLIDLEKEIEGEVYERTVFDDDDELIPAQADDIDDDADLPDPAAPAKPIDSLEDLP